MKLRFKLRTLLIATALVAVFLGLQMHVHMKARRFVDEVTELSDATQERLVSDTGSPNETRYHVGSKDGTNNFTMLKPISFGDVIFMRRRCEVTFMSTRPMHDGELYTEHRNHYTFFLDREKCFTDTLNTQRFVDLGLQLQRMRRSPSK